MSISRTKTSVKAPAKRPLRSKIQRAFGYIGLLAALAIPATQLWAATDTITYQYDALGRLVAESNATSPMTIYQYDAAGNRLAAGRQIFFIGPTGTVVAPAGY